MMRVTIVDGGMVGLAAPPKKILPFCPDLCVCVLEKETGIVKHQSGHNSGIVYSGRYYIAGSVKPRLLLNSFYRWPVCWSQRDSA